MLIIKDIFSDFKDLTEKMEGRKFILPIMVDYYSNFDTPDGVFDDIFVNRNSYNSIFISIPKKLYSVLSHLENSFTTVIGLSSSYTPSIIYMIDETEKTVDSFCAFCFKHNIELRAGARSYLINKEVSDGYEPQKILLIFDNENDFLKVKMHRE